MKLKIALSRQFGIWQLKFIGTFATRTSEHSRSPAYTGAITHANGSGGYMLTRQRAVIVFEAGGTTPRHLINAGSFDEYNAGTTSIHERTFFFQFVAYH